MKRQSTRILSVLIALFMAAFVSCQSARDKKDDGLKTFKALSGKVSVLAPEDFKWMSKAMIRLKYPSQTPPDAVLTNRETTTNVTFQLRDNGVPLEQYDQMKSYMTEYFKSLYPGMIWISNEVEEINSQKFLVMEMITPAIDTDIYNLMMMTTTRDGKQVIVTFNCLNSERSKWKGIAYKMKESVRLH